MTLKRLMSLLTEYTFLSIVIKSFSRRPLSAALMLLAELSLCFLISRWLQRDSSMALSYITGKDNQNESHYYIIIIINNHI